MLNLQGGIFAGAGVLVGVAAGLVLLALGWMLVRQARSLVALLRQALESPRDIGSGPTSPSATSAAPAPPELSGMLAKLDSAQRLNARQFQLQRSQFELFKRMRGDQDPETLAASILEFVGDRYEAPVGAFYLARPGQRLDLAACYGTGDTEPRAEIRMGQGIVGRAALRRRILVLNDVGEEHLRLDTALGTSAPRTVVVAPFHFAGQVKGVLELGVSGPVEEKDLDFLKLSAESVAMALDSARSRARVHRLLEETRRQAAVLAQQQKDLQATNDQLARSDRYKSEFLANMSHELRTPLNSMLIMSQVLGENRDGRLSRDEVESAVTINKAGRELLMIINDILDMSMVESGKLELHPEPLDPRSLARGIEDLFRPVAERQGLELKLHVDADVPHALVTDRLRVSQILKNLLDNAFKFTERGSIALRVGRPDAKTATALDGDPASWLAFSVEDTGIGMDAETSRRIFEVFQQGDGSIARRYGGSGLGLSISRSLAELLGGDITLRSNPGAGSTFILCLPLLSNAVGTKDATIPDEPPANVDDVTPAEATAAWRGLLAGRRVLLADDDMRTVYGVCDLLDAMGAEVIIAHSAQECGRHVAARPEVDLALINPSLRRTPDGPSCVEEAQLQDRELEGVLLCNDPTEAPYGCDWPVLTKPVQPARLAEICGALQGREQQPA